MSMTPKKHNKSLSENRQAALFCAQVYHSRNLPALGLRRSCLTSSLFAQVSNPDRVFPRGVPERGLVNLR